MGDWTRTPAGIHRWTVNGVIRAEVTKRDGARVWDTAIYAPGVNADGLTRSYAMNLAAAKAIIESVYRVEERKTNSAPVSPRVVREEYARDLPGGDYAPANFWNPVA